MIKSQITLKQLEAFAFVVDTGTFRAAAAALGTTQPNVSARIAALEASLGVVLLHRDAGSVRLTTKGAALLEKTRNTLRAGEALLEVANRRDLIEERLRLGVTELIACTWLREFLRTLKQEYPNLQIELQVDLSNQIEERLIEGQLDLALQNGPFKTELTATYALASAPYTWVANPILAADLSPGTSVARFFHHSVLTHAKHTGAGTALHNLAAERGFDMRKIIHSSALTACVPMACEGLGVALLPRSLVATELANGALIAQDADWVADPLTFFARFDAERAPRYVTRACAIACELQPANDQKN